MKKRRFKQLTLFDSPEEFTDGGNYHFHRYSSEEQGMANMLLSFLRGNKNKSVANLYSLNRAYTLAVCRLLLRTGHIGWLRLQANTPIEFYDVVRNERGQLLSCKARFINPKITNTMCKMKQVTIEIHEDKCAEWVNGVVLTPVEEEKKDNRPVTERIKTFQDACNELGEVHPFVIHYGTIFPPIDSQVCQVCDIAADVHAYLKLRIITAALNEGWEPQFTENELKYYPAFYLYTREEIDNMDEDDKKELFLWGGNAYSGAYCGLAYMNSNNAYSYSYASYGARLAYKTSELAKYSGQQFKDIWADFLLIKSQNNNTSAGYKP